MVRISSGDELFHGFMNVGGHVLRRLKAFFRVIDDTPCVTNYDVDQFVFREIFYIFFVL